MIIILEEEIRSIASRSRARRATAIHSNPRLEEDSQTGRETSQTIGDAIQTRGTITEEMTTIKAPKAARDVMITTLMIIIGEVTVPEAIRAVAIIISGITITIKETIVGLISAAIVEDIEIRVSTEEAEGTIIDTTNRERVGKRIAHTVIRTFMLLIFQPRGVTMIFDKNFKNSVK